MSEYQYYEFEAVDRRLTEAEMAEVRTLSSRVVLKPTSAHFVYHYGDFPGKPEAVLVKYFDAMLYLANWGTRQVMFRWPQALVNREALQPNELLRAITVETHGPYVPSTC